MKNHKMRRTRKFSAVKKRVTTSLVFIGATTVICIFMLGAWQLRNIFEPLSTHASQGQTATVDPNSNTIFICFTNSDNEIEQLHIVYLNTNEKSVREMVIPSNTISTLPLGLAEYQLKHILKVLQLDPNQSLNEFELVQQALQNLTGTLADEVIFIEASAPQSAIDWLSDTQNILNTILNPELTQSNISTHLSRAQVIEYMWNILRTKPYAKRTHLVSDSYIKQDIQLKDGAQVIKIDQVKNDILVKSLFENLQLSKEGLQIRIINATKTNGLAAHLSRLITNSGGIVVEVNNSEEYLETTQITIHSQHAQDSYTKNLIKNALHISPQTELKIGNFHYDITIWIGQDYANFMQGE